ncbi:MAG: molybdopterin-synthase adenylyltransferase MoeB [Kangiellaceae bacterium]|nr:molybdopterin-synthase adenylyltransferase MoeB [Kangiellaceae bacterium]
MLTDDELLRYSRQIMLPQIDIEGQQKLKEAHVIVLGLGGLGSPVALYLAAAGVGHLTLIDDDQVEVSNLQRQIIHQHESQGQDKVQSALQSIKQLNPLTKVSVINRRLEQPKLLSSLGDCSVVADCSDNFKTRFMVNEVCVKTQTPLVSGAAIRWEGQLTTFPMDDNSSCYACLYDLDSHTDESCVANGVVGPVVGIIGSMQALEVIKLITGAGKLLTSNLLLFDGMDMSCNKIKYKKNTACSVCSHSYS